MKKQFLYLLLLGLMCSIGNAWGADGNLPSQPTTSLDLSTQSTYTPDGNGWIVFDPYNIAGSPTWFTYTTKSSQSSGLGYTAEGSEFVAPFVDIASDASSYKINYTGSYSVAVRFTGAEKASFLVCPRSSKSFYVGLYSVNTSTNAETLVEEKSASGNDVFEIIYSSLTPSTTYVAYFYGKVKQNMSLMEIALKAPASGPSLAVSPSSASPFTYVVDNGPSAEQTFTITGSNLTNPISASLSNSAYEMRIGSGEWSDGPLAPESGNVIGVRLKSGKSLGTYNGNLTFSSTGADSKVISLVGSVTNQTYSVTYDLNGASGDAPTEAAKESGASFTLAAAPYRACYTFAGWRCNVDGNLYAAGEEYTMTADETTFTAQWTPNYSSSADLTSSSVVSGKPNVNTYLAASNIVSNITFNSGDYEFTSNETKKGYYGYKVKTSGNTIKMLVKQGKQVKVLFGSLANAPSLSVNGTAKSLDASKQSGDNVENTFTYNASAADAFVEIQFGSGTSTLKSITITDVYTVTYDGNGKTGGSVPVDASSPYVSGSTVTVLGNTGDLVKTGYGFAGWNTQADGKGTSYAPDATFTISANTTLYAKWAETFTVTYKANGGEGADEIDTNAALVADNPFTYDGHEFTGWNTEDDGTGIAYAVGATVSSNLDLFAQWAELYTVTKGDHDNGDFTISKNPAIAGDEITLTATPNEDYLFESWDVYKTGESSTKVTVVNNKFTMPAYAVTVDASFVADPRRKVLYVTKNSADNTKLNDKLYAALKDTYNVKIVGAAFDGDLDDYDLVVLHESVDGSSYNATAVAAAKTTSVPVLNTKSYFYNEGRWGWGTPNAGQSVKGATQNSTTYSNIASHPIFAGVTVSTGFFEITDDAAAKCMQPIGSFETGFEGYTLATTPNSDSGNGAAIHEIPAGTARGASSGKYLLISVSNAKLDALNANGQKLFQNAAAYLMSDDSWIPNKVSGKITAAGWSTFSSPCNLDLSNITDGEAYVASDATGSVVTLTKCTDKVEAGTGLMIKGTANATFTINSTADDATFTGDNLLKGHTTTGIVAASTAGAYHYVFGFKKPAEVVTEYGFYNLSAETTIPAGKAYLETAEALLTGGPSAPAVIRILDEENNATSIERIDGKNDAIKFIENGQLYILREGVVYDALGRKVR